MNKKENRFDSFLIRIRQKEGDGWYCSVHYIQGGESISTNTIDKIPEIIKKILNKKEA